MNKAKVAALDALYRRLPTVECKGLCRDACGPVPHSDLEAKRIYKKLHVELGYHPTGTCNLLGHGRCQAYDLRPLICRLYGVADGLTCDHGCRPTRLLTREQVSELLAEAEAISPTSDRSVGMVRVIQALRGR